MDNGYRVVNELPPDFTPDYTRYLFNHPQHLRLQAKAWLHFYLLKPTGKRCVAAVSFHLEKKIAVTPARAPFGSFQFSEHLSPKVLYEFVQHCEGQLIRKGIRSISIKEPPLFYHHRGELLHALFINLGFHVSKAEISSGITIDKSPFRDKIEAWEKRKLKQSQSGGLSFRKLPLRELSRVYDFILGCRQERGHSLSMTAEELKRTADIFKKSFLLFGIFEGKELAAASICIQVSTGILYNFYSGHLKKHDSVSPVVLLTEGMYKFCATHKIKLLDLGTSAIDGQPNFNLLDFKLRLGAVPSVKFTFTKDVA